MAKKAKLKAQEAMTFEMTVQASPCVSLPAIWFSEKTTWPNPVDKVRITVTLLICYQHQEKAGGVKVASRVQRKV